jgi:hypothetical protein
VGGAEGGVAEVGGGTVGEERCCGACSLKAMYELGWDRLRRAYDLGWLCCVVRCVCSIVRPKILGGPRTAEPRFGWTDGDGGSAALPVLFESRLGVRRSLST